jgi:hypothetical protein
MGLNLDVLQFLLHLMAKPLWRSNGRGELVRVLCCIEFHHARHDADGLAVGTSYKGRSRSTWAGQGMYAAHRVNGSLFAHAGLRIEGALARCLSAVPEARDSLR